jgi:polyhydroxyalkanoate synthesis regulator protein
VWSPGPTSWFYCVIHGIRVDPLKVEAILNLPPPSTLRQLQSLQGKENFLRRFIPNYAEVNERIYSTTQERLRVCMG